MKTPSQNTLSNSTSLLCPCGEFTVTYFLWPSIRHYPISAETMSYLNTNLKKGIRNPVFHHFNIPNISPCQADSTPLPKKTHGIQLKGSSFSKTVSFSLNFLRRSVRTCFHLKKTPAMLKKGLDSAGTLPPFTLHVVQRCVCFEKCEQTFVIITWHFHPHSLKEFAEVYFSQISAEACW